MIRSPRDIRNAEKNRRRAMRLQHQHGKPQLPSRRARLVQQGPSDPAFNYDEFQEIGFEVRKNPKNRFCAIRWHYTEDPDKRDPEFARLGREKNPQGWDQEQEIDFSSKRGIRVFSEFPWRREACDLGPWWSSQSNVILPTVKPPAWWPLWLATDPGRNRCWATLFILVDEYGCCHVVRSIVKPGLHYSEAKKSIAGLLGRRRPVDHVIDPASKQRRTDSVKTLLEKMADRPFPMICNPVDHLSNEYLELEELRERMMRRPDGRYGMYFWDTPENQACIIQYRNAVYKDDYGEKLDTIDVDAVDAGKYFATYTTGRAIRPAKPVEEMGAREFRAHLAHKRRQTMERQMSQQQRARNSLIMEELESGMSVEP